MKSPMNSLSFLKKSCFFKNMGLLKGFDFDKKRKKDSFNELKKLITFAKRVLKSIEKGSYFTG